MRLISWVLGWRERARQRRVAVVEADQARVDAAADGKVVPVSWDYMRWAAGYSPRWFRKYGLSPWVKREGRMRVLGLKALK